METRETRKVALQPVIVLGLGLTQHASINIEFQIPNVLPIFLWLSAYQSQDLFFVLLQSLCFFLVTSNFEMFVESQPLWKFGVMMNLKSEFS